MSDIEPRRPIEITLRIDPSAVITAGQRTAGIASAGFARTKDWCRDHSRGLSLLAVIAAAGIGAAIVGGLGRGLGFSAAAAIIAGLIHLKTRVSPLIRD